MTLLLIRHAKAGKRGPDYPDDSQRPLTREGRAQARKLAELFKSLGIRFDALFSSPATRTLETAKPLETRFKKGSIETLQSLTTDLYPQLLVDIATKSGDNGVKRPKNSGKVKNTVIASCHPCCWPAKLELRDISSGGHTAWTTALL